MANIVLVCVAGVSGTFLANGIRRIDPTLTTVVTSYSALPGLDVGDVVLVAPQLAAVLEDIRDLVRPRPVALLSSAAGAAGAESALAQARDLLPDSPYRGLPVPELKE
jgi:cellobiose-specific phosphotransferase system component IIB